MTVPTRVEPGLFVDGSDVLAGSRCRQCGTVTFPRQQSCPRCTSTGVAEHTLAEEGTLWAFTEPGHPAHPAWVAKRVIRVDQAVGIQQVGYFAGDEVAFGRLFRSYDRAPAD